MLTTRPCSVESRSIRHVIRSHCLSSTWQTACHSNVIERTRYLAIAARRIWRIVVNLVNLAKLVGPQRNLNCVLSIPNALMRWSSVDGGTPSLAAAPDRPATRPRDCGERRFDDLPLASGFAFVTARVKQQLEVVVGLVVSTAMTRRRQRPHRSSESRTAQSRSAAHGYCLANRSSATNPTSSCRSSGSSCPRACRSVARSTRRASRYPQSVLGAAAPQWEIH